jgi:hypothetical protein
LGYLLFLFGFHPGGQYFPQGRQGFPVGGQFIPGGSHVVVLGGRRKGKKSEYWDHKTFLF